MLPSRDHQSGQVRFACRQEPLGRLEVMSHHEEGIVTSLCKAKHKGGARVGSFHIFWGTSKVCSSTMCRYNLQRGRSILSILSISFRTRVRLQREPRGPLPLWKTMLRRTLLLLMC